MFGSIKKTINYFKRNGFTDTWYAVQERLWEKKHVKYEYEPPVEEELKVQRGKKYDRPLKFSIVVPAYETAEVFLQDLILSVEEQTYSDYELIIADASESNKVGAVVKSFMEQYDNIVYHKLDSNGGISVNTNAAIDMATGDYIALLDHDDFITPDALYLIREKIDKSDQPVLVYSDEDKTDRYIERWFDHHKKRDFDRELILSNNYICHFSVFRADVIKELKLRKDFDGAQDHDLILRTALWCREKYGEKQLEEKICHVPQVLYHWRCHEDSTAADPAAKQYAFDAGRHAIEEALNAEGIKAEVKEMKHLGFFRVEYEGGIFEQRPDVGIVGGPLFKDEKTVGGAMEADGKLIFDGLYQGFSGPMHIAALRQCVPAVDLRNAVIREELIPLYKEITGYEYPFPGDDDIERVKGKSLKFCNKLREKGIIVVYDPEQRNPD